MKKKQKKEITGNYHLLTKVESGKCRRVTSSFLFQFYILLLRMVFECLARFKVAFNTLSTAVLAKEKCFAEVAG